jgi:hypothetical protein
MRWIYKSGTDKQPPPSSTQKPVKTAASGGFFSSLFNSFSAPVAPSRTSTPAPMRQLDHIDPLQVDQLNVTLSIYSVDADVKLDKKLTTELYRSTKKNPPQKLKYELIYVSDANTQMQCYLMYSDYRLQRTIMTPAKRKTKICHSPLEASFKAYVQTWKGMATCEMATMMFTVTLDLGLVAYS